MRDEESTAEKPDIFFCPLASGSKGNCVLVETPTTTLLFDVGISLKSLEARLQLLGKSASEIDAVVISHEHHDHISGIRSLVSKYQIPLIANYATAEAVVEELQFDQCPQFHIFTSGEPFEWCGVEIDPFSVQHDSVEPVGFTVTTSKRKIALCTDLGFVTTSVRHRLKGCDILYIEANHKPEMVHISSRPDTYKKRVLSRLGHLSNEDSAQAIVESATDRLKRVYLAHLSSECNSESVAHSTVLEHLERHGIRIPLYIAYQDRIAEPFSL